MVNVRRVMVFALVRGLVAGMSVASDVRHGWVLARADRDVRF